MGNCCGKTPSSSAEHWGGDDWSSLTSEDKSSTKVLDELNRDLLLSASASSNYGKIKIKITKKELQVLLREIEKQKMMKKKKGIRKVKSSVSAEQVLVRLMGARDLQRHRAGRNRSPVLESIPEVD
ncbi:uncharacterized protein LOC129298941 [Prosopis cineraria]|uniref:uncharacterized protein LOC129298941 n=1 Tax=Prosopis cineraria TaxID=364024 RepID=UPI00240F833F|nr:uncharacterized protein LOC129298941 [Prosopis cineraria]